MTATDHTIQFRPGPSRPFLDRLVIPVCVSCGSLTTQHVHPEDARDIKRLHLLDVARVVDDGDEVAV